MKEVLAMVKDNEIFLSLDLSRHDRYLIYRMLGRNVTFPLPSKKQARYSGVAQRVCRDIFDSYVELTVNGRLFRFKEPAVMLQDGDSAILFIYGNVEASDMSDNALFQEMRNSMGETAGDVIRRTTPTKTCVTRFLLGPKTERVPSRMLA